MRNLKRALSLLLSSTMVLGMLVMGSSAAGYQDVDASNVNQEAIEVLQTVGIMTGDQNGNFNPDGSITRNEMAVVMAHLLNLDYDYYRGTNPFTDVPEWAAPYVAACAAEGVVAGIGNGQYGGNNKVTAAEASLMIMKALGYFQNAEDFGTDWQVATIRQASYINLFANINSDADSALTRAQVAQLVLNGLKAKMVDFTGDKGIQIGDVTVGYRAEYSYKTSAAAKYNTIDDGTTNIAENDQYYIQLGEELYNGNLKLAGDEADAFGRPARVWSYNGEEIGTYVNYDLMVKEYTTSVTGKELYETVGKTAFDKYDFASYVDGADNDLYKEISKDNKADVSETGNGALTQVFVDADSKDVVVTVINTYLADATMDYNEKKDEVSFQVYGLQGAKKNPVSVSGEDFDVADIAEGDFVLVNYSFETEAIEVISDVETLSKVTITRFTSNDEGSNSGTDVSSMTVDGTKYSSSNTLTYDVDVLKNYTNSNLKDKTYNVYLDKYGYAIGVEEVDAADNYLFMTGINTDKDYLATANYDANVIFTDGTSAVVKVKSNDDVRDAIKNAGSQALINKWFKYTKSTSDVYTLTAITENMDLGTDSVAQDRTTKVEAPEINDRHISLIGQIEGKDSRIYGNENSVYMLADLDTVTVDGTTYGVIAGADEVITGVDNTNIEVMDSAQVASDLTTDKVTVNSGNSVGGTYVLYNDDGIVIAAVVVGENAGVSSNVAYAISSKAAEESYENGVWTWTRDVVINGEIVTLTEVSDEDESLLADVMKQGYWYTVKYDADGNVKKVELYNEASEGVNYADDFEEAVQALRDEDLVVLEINNTRVDYSKNGRALYDWSDKAKDAGIMTSSDVKFVIRQESKNATTTQEYTGWNQLVSALETLNENPNHYYNFSAVIEQGRITSVVIVDKNPDGDYQGPDGGEATEVKAVVMTDDGKVSLQGKDGKVINTQGYSYELWMRGPSQDSFNVAKTGKFGTNAPDFQLDKGSSYYLVVDGVKSDVITATAP